MKTAAAALTIADLERTLEDDRHNGYGFAQASTHRLSELTTAYSAVIWRANELGWDYEALFAWSNSRLARIFWDEHTFSLTRALEMVRRPIEEPPMRDWLYPNGNRPFCHNGCGRRVYMVGLCGTCWAQKPVA